MKRILKIVVSLPLVFLILGNMYITIESQSTISTLSGNLTAPVPTSTLTEDQKEFAPPPLLGTFLVLPPVLLGLCCSIPLLLGMFIFSSIGRNQNSKRGSNG